MLVSALQQCIDESIQQPLTRAVLAQSRVTQERDSLVETSRPDRNLGTLKVEVKQSIRPSWVPLMSLTSAGDNHTSVSF
jgi:hypothetical protein